MAQNQILVTFANNITTANSTGLYYSGTINATAYNIASYFSVNTSILNINSLGLNANGSVGSANQVLTSNGSATYWANSSGGSSKGTSYGYSILFGS